MRTTEILIDPHPFVTVLMPVRNEERYMRASLEAVLTQDYPTHRMEVLVVDGMSTDATREIIRGFQEDHPELHLLDNPGKIVPTAMNAGIPLARGEVLIRVDGHCRIAPDYVRRCVDHLRRDDVDGVGGPMKTVGDTRTARVIAAAMSSRFGVGGSAFRTISDTAMFTDSIPFPAYSRAIVARAGPYDEELVRNQDDEYNYRLRQLGGKLFLAPDVKSEYYSRSTLRSLWSQYYQYGYWKVRVMQKHPRQMSARQFVPALFVLALVASAAAIPVAGALGWGMFASVAGSYALANGTASLLTSRKEGMGLLPWLPGAFVTLHLSYGLGFLVGILKFRKRWRERSR